ncbi:MAG: nicotinate (nicotinamide) nucleotide adenylyltransferase [Clostridia bacterium]|nr:nicotinate (nicotinamide) nucleotide adenylyltransferase [Clostridia bacterium]
MAKQSLWQRIKSFFKRLFKHPIKTLKWTLIRLYAKLRKGGKRLILIFVIVWLIFASPTIVGYLLYFLTKNAWHLTYANAWFGFWMFAPGTPMLPLCAVIAIAINTTISKIFKVKSRKAAVAGYAPDARSTKPAIGIFGGTFDPPHNSHVELVRRATVKLGLSKTLVIPNGDAPHKLFETDKMHRLAMTELAFADLPVKVSLDEVLREGKSYTADTVKELAEKYSKYELILILGGDSLLSFDNWYHPEEIARYVSFAVAVRGGSIRDKIREIKKKYNAIVYELEPVAAISSTEIRMAVEMGIDKSDCVNPKVYRYIERNKLYSKYSELCEKLRWYLDEERYMHTYYVVLKGIEYAEALGEDRDSVIRACLLHDCAKQIAENESGCYKAYEKKVRHAFVGADLAKKEFGVNDEAILDAIRYHTTGRANMSRLEQIVYLADITERTRGLFAVDIVRTYEAQGFNEAFRFAVEKSWDYLNENMDKKDICALSKEAYDFYCKDEI